MECVQLFKRTRPMALWAKAHDRVRAWSPWTPVEQSSWDMFPLAGPPAWGPFMTPGEADAYIRRYPGGQWEVDATEREYARTEHDMPGLWGLVEGEWREKHGPELRKFWDRLEDAITRTNDPGILLWGRNQAIPSTGLDPDQAEYVKRFPDQALRVACRSLK